MRDDRNAELVGTAPRATAASGTGRLISSGVAVIEQAPHTCTTGVATIQRTAAREHLACHAPDVHWGQGS